MKHFPNPKQVKRLKEEVYEVLLTNDGKKSCKEIAEEFGCHEQNIYHMAQRIKDLGGTVVFKGHIRKKTADEKLKDLIRKYQKVAL